MVTFTARTTSWHHEFFVKRRYHTLRPRQIVKVEAATPVLSAAQGGHACTRATFARSTASVKLSEKAAVESNGDALENRWAVIALELTQGGRAARCLVRNVDGRAAALQERVMRSPPKDRDERRDQETVEYTIKVKLHREVTLKYPSVTRKRRSGRGKRRKRQKNKAKLMGSAQMARKATRTHSKNQS